MQAEILLAGFGGQGVMFAGQLLAYAAMDQGCNVTWIPSYGPEMRGGTAYCVVVISDQYIGAPVVSQPRFAVILNAPSFEKFAPQVAAGGLLAYNASLIERPCLRVDLTQLPIPAVDLAQAAGAPKMVNMIMLGALLTARPILPLDSLAGALEHHLLVSKREKLPDNLKALDAGAAFVRQHIGQTLVGG
jgi:2-oxoglutarate ferredoxin oxidoreductase subunit gamma